MIPTEELTSAELNSIIGDWAGATKDYVNDLNAVHEAEKKLIESVTLDKWQRYVELLVAACGKAERPPYVITALDHVTFAISATARQRCIALVKVVRNL